jgi:predicted ferric reductase
MRTSHEIILEIIHIISGIEAILLFHKFVALIINYFIYLHNPEDKIPDVTNIQSNTSKRMEENCSIASKKTSIKLINEHALWL